MNLFLFIVILSNIFSISLLVLGCQNINNYHAMIELNQPFHQPCYDIILSKNQININDMCCLDFINNNICTEEYKLCYKEYPNYDSNKNPSKETNKNNDLEKEHLGLMIILSILNFIAIIILIYLYRIHENIPQNDISPSRTRETGRLQPNPLYQDLETETDISEIDSDSYTSQDNIGYDTYDNIDRYSYNYKHSDLYQETDNRYDNNYDTYDTYNNDGYDKISTYAHLKNRDIYSVPMKPGNNEHNINTTDI